MASISAASRFAIVRRKPADLEVAYSDGPHQEPTSFCSPPAASRQREPRLEGGGREARCRRRRHVNKYSTTAVDSIHAIGDVTNRLNLTPVATAEAMWLARTLFRSEPTPVDHEERGHGGFRQPEPRQRRAVGRKSARALRPPWTSTDLLPRPQAQRHRTARAHLS